MRPAIFALSLTLLLAAASGPARAQAPAVSADLPVESLTATLVDIESRYREVETGLNRGRGSESAANETAAKRLVDAQVLYTLRNYDASATILFDLVDRYPRSPSYADALFYLGDSLFLKRDYLSSRRYFEKLVDTSPGHPRYQEALLRLLEVSLHLGQFDQVDRWLDRLARVPKDKLLAAVPYVRGKSYFLRQNYDPAIAALGSVQQTSPFYPQARYLIGAAHVSMGKLTEAINDFAGLIQFGPRRDDERRVIELAHLALGRIYYEQGQTTRAQDEYLQISQKSDLFADALFESAWVAIKSKDYKRAQRSLELLVLAQPDGLNAPEAKLLIGNLNIRIGEYQPATSWFVKTRDEFQPVQKRLEELMAQNADLAGYFRGLIEKNLTKFDFAAVLPPAAVRFLRGAEDVNRLSLLVGDVGELRRSLDESEETIRRLEKALTGSGRLRVDPDLGQAREQALTLAAEVIAVRRQLSERMLEATTMAASASERAELANLARRRGELEKDFARLLGAVGGKDRAERMREQVAALDRKAAELLVHLEGLKKQREAIEQYYNETKKQQRITPEQFQKELASMAQDEVTVRKAYDNLRRELGDAMASVGTDDAKVDAGGDQVRKEYAEVVQKENALMSALRQRLTGPQRQQADQIAAAFERAYAMDQKLSALASRVNLLIDGKVAEVQSSLFAERENLKGYRQALDKATTETQDVGGGVLSDAVKTTAKKFYDIVVRADVGVIDVAWALKQQRTDKISRLVREQKRELKLLDDEFKEVLKKE